jgi:hypothetical protein
LAYLGAWVKQKLGGFSGTQHGKSASGMKRAHAGFGGPRLESGAGKASLPEAQPRGIACMATNCMLAGIFAKTSSSRRKVFA